MKSLRGFLRFLENLFAFRWVRSIFRRPVKELPLAEDVPDEGYHSRRGGYAEVGTRGSLEEEKNLPRRSLPRPKTEALEEGSVTKQRENSGRILGGVIRRKKEVAHIQVGLDFGTSCTKVVFSEIGRPDFRVLCFNHRLTNYPAYCLPSLAAIDGSGRVVLGIQAARALSEGAWDEGFQRLKVIVAGNHDAGFRDEESERAFRTYHEKKRCDSSLTPERLMALFLAHVMRACREMLGNMKEYLDREAHLSFNVCIPIDHIEKSTVQTAFERVIKWAELIDRRSREVHGNIDLLEISNQVNPESPMEETRVWAVPEAVASVASYVKSLERQEGRHAVIDLGAGTTDVSIFNLAIMEGSPLESWMATRNIPRGTHRVERIVARHIGGGRMKSTCTFNSLHSYLRELKAVTEQLENSGLAKEIENELIDIRESSLYKKTWGLAYSKCRRESAFYNVQVLLCGGGSNLPFVEEVFAKPWWDQLKCTYAVRKIPEPHRYDGGNCVAPFERMSVAYGLAIPKPQLEGYHLPSEVGDHTPVTRTRDIPDAADVYSK
jgi:hypothetical protein